MSKLTKTESFLIAYSSSGALTAAGVGLMFVPVVGPIFGGLLLSAGIPSIINSVQQVINKDEEEFDFKKWGVTLGTGAVAGVVAAPVALAGGLIASGVTNVVGKAATIVASEVVGGAASGGVGTIFNKKVSGEEVTLKDVGVAMATGAISGGVGASVGQVAKGVVVAAQGGSTIANTVKSSAIAARVVASGVGGAIGGAGGAAIVKLVENLVTNGDITKDLFIAATLGDERDASVCEELWHFLNFAGVIVNNKIIKEVPSNLLFPLHLLHHRESIRHFIQQCLDVTNGIAEAAVFGGAMGLVMGTVSSTIENLQQADRTERQLQATGKDIRKGRWASSVEIEAYAKKQKVRVVVHTKDGKRVFGPRDSKVVRHVRFQDQHFYPADRSGAITAMNDAHPGDCFYTAMGENDPTACREAVARFVERSPEHLDIPERELWDRELVGGARRENDAQRRARMETQRAERVAQLERLRREPTSNGGYFVADISGGENVPFAGHITSEALSDARRLGSPGLANIFQEALARGIDPSGRHVGVKRLTGGGFEIKISGGERILGNWNNLKNCIIFSKFVRHHQ